MNTLFYTHIKQKAYLTALLLTMIVGCLPAWSKGNNGNNLSRIRQNVMRYLSQYPQERVYLHFDNTSYYKGEHIYYKANVVKGEDFSATPYSRILYVELVSPAGWTVETQKLAINNGQADGAFLLKDTLNAGFYEVRAYTAWMLNFSQAWQHGWHRLRNLEMQRKYGESLQWYLHGNAGLFSRVFPVYEKVEEGQYQRRAMVQAPKVTSDLEMKEKERVRVRFFPEGGNFVKGIPTRMAFEVSDHEGKHLSANCTLVKGGKPIGEASTVFDGRGFIDVVPDDDGTDPLAKDLTLSISYMGKDYGVAFPKAAARGYALRVDNRRNVKATISRNAATEGDTVALLVTCRGSMEHFQAVDLTREQTTTLAFDPHELTTGVNIFTLYSTTGRILAQREVFINNHDMTPLRLRCDSLRPTYKPYERIALGFQLCDTTGQAVGRPATVSLSVTAGADREQTFDTRNAMTDLLLSSEIKGFVPYPDYYFERDDDAHRLALDLLMMVQGWTRYDFEDMAADSLHPVRFPMEKNLAFRGRIFDAHYNSDEFELISGSPNSNRQTEMTETGKGYGKRIEWSEWNNEKKGLWLRIDLHTDKGFIIGDRHITSSDTFEIPIPPFYGSGKAYLLMNRKSMAKAGEQETDITHHLLAYGKITNRALENKYVIQPLNPFGPLPKPYDFYETIQADPMANLEFNGKQNTGQPDVTPADMSSMKKQGADYILAPLTKTAKRVWNTLDYNQPALSVGIDDMMAFLCNVEGRMFLFDIPANNGYFVEPNGPFLANMLGIDGWFDYTINGKNKEHYVYATGFGKSLPTNKEYLPKAQEYRHMDFFAEMHNRDLIYRQGRYGEKMQTGKREERNVPYTLRINYASDSLYTPGIELPQFTGNQIKFNGINYPVEFYSPDYSKQPLPEQTDYRRTLYWNPNLTTDDQGHATASFYNRGTETTLHLSAEGITPGGDILLYRL